MLQHRFSPEPIKTIINYLHTMILILADLWPCGWWTSENHIAVAWVQIGWLHVQMMRFFFSFFPALAIECYREWWFWINCKKDTIYTGSFLFNSLVCCNCLFINLSMSLAALNANVEIRLVMDSVCCTVSAPWFLCLFLMEAGVWGEGLSPYELLTTSFWKTLILKPAVQIQQHSRIWIFFGGKKTS